MAAPGTEPQPYLILRPRKGWQIIPIRELLEFRDLLNTLALRDVKLRYPQTTVGVLRARIAYPLLARGKGTEPAPHQCNRRA